MAFLKKSAILGFLCLALSLGAEAGRPRVAVVLSGGSAFGLAHVGVLQEIEAAGIPIDLVVGTSMGSIVGGLYASGYSPGEMEQLLGSMDWASVLYDNRASTGDNIERRLRESYSLRLGLEGRSLQPGEGLIYGQNILTEFTLLTSGTLGVKDFDALPIPYRAVATDLLSGEKVVLSSGSMAEAMRASMSIPGLFSPYNLGGRLLVDGGVVDDLPTDIAKELGADIIIAVVSRGPSATTATQLNSPLAIAAQTADLMVRQNLEKSKALADLVITCDLHGFTTASYSAALRLVARGREAGIKAQPELSALAAQIGKSRALVSPEGQPNRSRTASPPAIVDLRVEGGSAEDEALGQGYFAPLLGRSYSLQELKSAIDGIYASGRFDLVGFSVVQTPQGSQGLLRLQGDESSKAALYGGLSYTGIYSTELSSSLVVGTAFLARGLTGKNSSLLVSGGFLGALDLEASYVQALGHVFLKPWARYYSAYDTLTYANLGVALGDRSRSAGLGLDWGLTIGRNSLVSLGYAYENVLSSSLGGDSAQNLSELRLDFSLDGRDSSAVPEKGGLLYGFACLSGDFLGGDRTFLQTEIGFDLALKLGPKSYLGLAGIGGYDFSELWGSGLSTPYLYQPSLRHQGLFYGYSPVATTIVGNEVLGLGLEYRHRLMAANPLLGRWYLFSGASAGWALSPPSLPGLDNFLWCASAGVKARLSRYLGLALALSLLPDDANSPVGALSIDFGSFVEDPSKRR